MRVRLEPARARRLTRRHTFKAATLLAALDMLAGSATARAQDAQIPTPTGSRPLVLVGAGYAAPTRWTGGVGLLIPLRKPRENGDLGDLQDHRGLQVEASAGVDGARISIGPAFVGKPPAGPVLFAGDVLAGFTRTWNSSHRATAESSYVGLEGGVTLLMVRLSAGIAHRVGGPEGPNATILTWSLGMQTGW